MSDIARKQAGPRRHASKDELASFTTESLTSELNRRGWGGMQPLSTASTQQLLEELRVRGGEGAIEDFEDAFDLREAAARFRRGEIPDALHYLERALPSDFAGLAQLADQFQPKAAA